MSTCPTSHPAATLHDGRHPAATLHDGRHPTRAPRAGLPVTVAPTRRHPVHAPLDGTPEPGPPGARSPARAPGRDLNDPFAPAGMAILPMLVLLTMSSGCLDRYTERRLDARVSPSAAAPWRLPPEARRTAPPARGRPSSAPTAGPSPRLPPPGFRLELEQALDIALQNSPTTRATWMQARAAAAAFSSSRAGWYPAIDIGAQATYTHQSALGGTVTFTSFTAGPTASLSWLLLDFGGRTGRIDEARQAFYAAGWAHDTALQDLVLEVESTWFQYLSARALVTAAEASRRQASELLAAADERHVAGVATIADVLQARTALAQADLTLEQVQGQQAIIRGSLATALGLPSTLEIEVAELPARIEVGRDLARIDELLARAEQRRPDLAAAKARAEQARAHVRTVRGGTLPSLSLAASFNRAWYIPSQKAPYGDNYSIGLSLAYPLFTGLRNTWDLAEARALAGAAGAQIETTRQRIALQVWSSYYALRTAARQVDAARQLLESATASEEVARGRYREGVGSILDLLSAQQALASARAQEVQARAGYLTATAQLAHDTGALEPPSAGTDPAASQEAP